ncbi:MAG: helix-turn-helix domain-containing protein [Gemmatimonadaceae bacterium]
MRAAARLSDPLLTSLRVALIRNHTVVPVQSWSVLDELLQRRGADVVVIEPTQLFRFDLADVRTLLAVHTDVPVVIYTSVSSVAMRGTVEFARVGIRHLVIKGLDDSPRRFAALLEELAAGTWESPLFTSYVQGLLGHSSSDLGDAVERLFRFPEHFPDVESLARAAGIHRRNLERGLHRAGIASAKTLIACARVERAYQLLHHGNYSLEATARRLGCANDRQLARSVRWATGMPPRRLRYGVRPEELRANLTRRLSGGVKDHVAEA